MNCQVELTARSGVTRDLKPKDKIQLLPEIPQETEKWDKR